MGNLLFPREEWVVDTSGGSNGWSQNGNTAENDRFYSYNPWGQKATVWHSQCDGVLTGTEPYETPGEGESNADGGWQSPAVACDPTQKYRYTWWIKRTYGDYGRNYFGWYTYNSSYTLIGNLYHSSKASATNHYFFYSNTPPTSAEYPENEWVLVVAHVWPYNDPGTANDSESGIYLTDGTKHANIYYDMEFEFDTTAYISSRSYMYYCIITADASPWATTGDLDLKAHTYWYWPRIELVDGNEPTITEIIRNANYQATMLAGNGLSLSVQCNELQNRG